MTPVYLHKSGCRIYIDGKDKVEVLKNLREVLKSWGWKISEIKEIKEEIEEDNK